jgi:hypothetical protein
MSLRRCFPLLTLPELLDKPLPPGKLGCVSNLDLRSWPRGLGHAALSDARAIFGGIFERLGHGLVIHGGTVAVGSGTLQHLST